MTGAELIAAGQEALARSHRLILLGGGLGVLSIAAGLISRRIGAPVLLADPQRDERLFASIFILVIASRSCNVGPWPRSSP